MPLQMYMTALRRLSLERLRWSNFVVTTLHTALNCHYNEATQLARTSALIREETWNLEQPTLLHFARLQASKRLTNLQLTSRKQALRWSSPEHRATSPMASKARAKCCYRTSPTPHHQIASAVPTPVVARIPLPRSAPDPAPLRFEVRSRQLAGEWVRRWRPLVNKRLRRSSIGHRR
ncbi:hypothetical protein BKA80DRAFT_142633 [Phyllosticta citrichinensis]